MPIKIFYGSDRIAARKAAERVLGADYEVIEAEQLTVADLESIFRGVTIFDMGAERKILLKDLSANEACFEKLPEYADTTATVALLEGKLSKVKASVKAVFACKDIEAKEFTSREDVPITYNGLTAPYNSAFAGHGADAIRKLRAIKDKTAAPAYIGLMGTETAKALAKPKAQQAMKIIAKADMMMKSAKVDMWVPVEWALLEIAQLK